MGRYGANPEKLAPAVREKPARYFVWDILWLNGESLVSRPLMERKAVLEEVFDDSTAAVKVDFVEGCGTDLFAAVEDLDLEGMVAKRRHSRYEAGRESRNWLKVKNYKSTAVDVVGVSKQDGALIVASGGKVVGHAIGMPAAQRRELREMLPRLASNETRTTVWIEPVLKARVGFTTRTPRGNLRDCSFLEWVDSGR